MARKNGKALYGCKNRISGGGIRSRVHARVKRLFTIQIQKNGNPLPQTIGIIRLRAKIGLRNLAHNIDWAGMLRATSG